MSSTAPQQDLENDFLKHQITLLPHQGQHLLETCWTLSYRHTTHGNRRSSYDRRSGQDRRTLPRSSNKGINSSQRPDAGRRAATSDRRLPLDTHFAMLSVKMASLSTQNASV